MVCRVRLLICVGLMGLAACAKPSGVTPNHGRVSGGDPVRITGEGFLQHGAPVAYVGPRAAKGIVVESDRSLLLTTPEADEPGLVDVAVHFADGTVVDRPGAFQYEASGVILRKQ